MYALSDGHEMKKPAGAAQSLVAAAVDQCRQRRCRFRQKIFVASRTANAQTTSKGKHAYQRLVARRIVTVASESAAGSPRAFVSFSSHL